MASMMRMPLPRLYSLAYPAWLNPALAYMCVAWIVFGASFYIASAQVVQVWSEILKHQSEQAQQFQFQGHLWPGGAGVSIHGASGLTCTAFFPPTMGHTKPDPVRIKCLQAQGCGVSCFSRSVVPVRFV